jgi:Ala-tRNA(Pro) deacylase
METNDNKPEKVRGMLQETMLEYLKCTGVPYDAFDHPPVFTCDEANALIPDLPGQSTKNLFVRDRKGKRHFLIVVPDEKSVDLLALESMLECSRLSMGSPERLGKHLGVSPGAVSLLAVANDIQKCVELVIDEPLWNGEALQCHPLVNTSTFVIPIAGVKGFLEQTGHIPKIIEVPQR